MLMPLESKAATNARNEYNTNSFPSFVFVMSRFFHAEKLNKTKLGSINFSGSKSDSMHLSRKLIC